MAPTPGWRTASTCSSGPAAPPARPRSRPCRIGSSRSRTSSRRPGGGRAIPKAADLAATAAIVVPGVAVVTFGGPFESIEAMKGVARDVRGLLPSGVIALGLDADEPQIFVTVSPDLVECGVAAGELVRRAVARFDGRGGGRPE